MTRTVNTEPYDGKYPCDRCGLPATVTQWWYRGNSDDRIGPLVTFRCSTHQERTTP